MKVIVKFFIDVNGTEYEAEVVRVEGDRDSVLEELEGELENAVDMCFDEEPL